MTFELIDLTGRTYGGLTVLERAESRPFPGGHRRTMWWARCTCGARVEVGSSNLRKGLTRSCGEPACRDRHRAARDALVALAGAPEGSVGTTAALLRASVDDDHGAIAAVVAGLDDDEVLGVLLQVLRIASTALVKAEDGPVAAHGVIDSLARVDRQVTRRGR